MKADGHTNLCYVIALLAFSADLGLTMSHRKKRENLINFDKLKKIYSNPKAQESVKKLRRNLYFFI